MGSSSCASKLLYACSLLAALAAPVESRADARADKVKAVFLIKLINYVTWPDTSKMRVLCVLEPDPFGDLLETLTKLQGEPYTIKRVRAKDDIKECQVLYSVDDSYNKQNKGVLTVSEKQGFARKGGMVEMHEAGDRVLLVINVVAMDNASLKANSHVLGIAEVIR